MKKDIGLLREKPDVLSNSGAAEGHILLFPFYHFAFHVEAYEGVRGVGTYTDTFFEVSRQLVFAVVLHLYLSAFSRGNGFFRKCRHGTSARGKGLVYHKGLVARVLELKDTGLHFVFGELSVVVQGTLKFYNSLCLSCYHCGCQHAEGKNALLEHGFLREIKNFQGKYTLFSSYSDKKTAFYFPRWCLFLYFCCMETPKREFDSRIILGIDPGTNILGYGLIATGPSAPRLLAMGVIDLRNTGDIYMKLGRIYERIMEILEHYKPDEMAIEAPFLGKNIQTTLKIGRAQGVVISAAISRQIPVREYSPSEIKQALTGRGSSSKEQVATLVQRALHIPSSEMPQYLDATDALAAAYCHLLQTSKRGVRPQLNDLVAPSRTAKRKVSSWADFVAQHKGRVHR